MNPGQLRSRIALERPAAGHDAAGQPMTAWVLVAAAWADIRLQSGLQAVRGNADVSLLKASIRLRYRSDVVAGMRAVCGATTYAIQAVLPDQARREYVDLVCEVVS